MFISKPSTGPYEFLGIVSIHCARLNVAEELLQRARGLIGFAGHEVITIQIIGMIIRANKRIALPSQAHAFLRLCHNIVAANMLAKSGCFIPWLFPASCRPAHHLSAAANLAVLILGLMRKQMS